MKHLHLHHIVPIHAGGTDDPSNLIELSIEEHAEAHRKLYEKNGNEYDHIAWLSLTKQITSAEANRLATIHYNKTRIYKHSEATKQKLREASIKAGCKPPIGVNNGSFKKGHKTWNKNKTGIFSENTLKIMSEKHKGNKNALGAIRSLETRQKISIANSGKLIGDKNPMASKENRKKVAASKLGRKWYHNPTTKQVICVLPENKPQEFLPGKKIKS